MTKENFCFNFNSAHKSHRFLHYFLHKSIGNYCFLLYTRWEGAVTYLFSPQNSRSRTALSDKIEIDCVFLGKGVNEYIASWRKRTRIWTILKCEIVPTYIQLSLWNYYIYILTHRHMTCRAFLGRRGLPSPTDFRLRHILAEAECSCGSGLFPLYFKNSMSHIGTSPLA